MTFEQLENTALNDADLTKIIERANPEEVNAFIRENRIREDADASLTERGQASAEFVAQKAQEEAELSTFVLDSTQPIKERVARLKEITSQTFSVENQKNMLQKKVEEEVAKKIPWFGKEIGEFVGSIFDWTQKKYDGWKGAIVGDIQKVISMGILGFLGLKSFLGETDNQGPSSEQPIPPTQENQEKPYGMVSLETRNNFYYFTGLNLLTHFAGNESDNSKETFESIRSIKFEDLKNTDSSILRSDNSSIQDNFEQTKISLLSSDSKTLLGTSLSAEKVTVILEKNINFLKDKISNERVSEITVALEEGAFSYEELTFNEISLLLFAGVNSLGILGLEGSMEGVDQIKSFISTDSAIDLENIEQELIGRRKGLISDSLFARFVGLGKAGKMGSATYMIDENLTGASAMDNLSEAEKVQLEKIISFKNWLLDGFLANNKNLINELGYTDDFKQSLNYKGVILLYLTLGGEESLQNMSAFDLPVLYEVTGAIIEWERPGRGSGYKSEVAKYIAGKDESDIFDDQEERSMEIIGAKLAFDWLEFSVNQLKKKLGKTTILFNDNIVGSVGTVAAGFGMMKYVGRLIPQARLVGLLVSMTGLGSLFTDLYGKESSILQDIKALFSGEEKQGDIDIFEYAQKIESFTDNIETREIEIKGKIETVSFYPGEKGLEVIHDGSIYRLDTGPSPFDVDVESLSDKVSRWNVNIGSQLSSKPLRSASIDTYKGREIDFSKMQFLNDTIVFGSNKESISLDMSKITDALSSGEILSPTKLFSSEKYENMEYLIVEKITNDEPTGELLGFTDYINKRFKQDLILEKIGEINNATS